MSRLGPTGLTQLLTDIKTWITTKLGNYVTTDTTQTVTGKKLFTASSIQLDSVTSMSGSTMFIDTSAAAPRGEFPAETHRVGRIYIGDGTSYNGAWFIVDPIIDTNRACYRMVTTNPDNTDSTRFSIVWDSTKEGVRRRRNVSMGDLLPSGASTYNLGESGNAWQDAYINKIHGISDYTNLKTNSFNVNTTLTHGGSGRRVILAMGDITLTVPAPEEGSWFLIKAVNGLVTLNLASNVTVTGITAGAFSGPIHLQPNESILLCYYSSTIYNATMSTIRRSGIVGRNGNVPAENPKHWFKVAENYVTATYRDPFICLRVFESTTGNTIGTLCAHCRINNTIGVVDTSNCYLQWQDAGGAIDLFKYALTTNETSGTGVTIALWCQLTGGYSSLKFEVVSECGQSDQLGNPEWVLTRRRQADGDLAELLDTDFTKIVYSTLTTLKNDTTGKASNVTGTVAIANGGTGATTRLNAVKALTNESVGTPTHFLAITTNWGKAGYTTVAQAKTVLGITGDMGSHSDSEYVHKTGNETITGVKTFNSDTLVSNQGNAYRIANSAGTGYGVFQRTDGANWYMLVTANDDPLGTWTSARPIVIRLSDGYCTINGKANEANKVQATIAAGTTAALVQASVASNDVFRIAAGGAANAGWAEIATGDDANEPIYVRQYNGAFATLQRTATLLDGSGNTSFPGTVTATGFSGPLTGDVTGTASKATSDANGREIATGYMWRGSYERIVGTSEEHKDLNTYQDAGFYNVKTALVDNCPSGIGVDAVLLVYPWDHGNYPTQEITEAAASSNARRWVRKCNNGTWSDWKRIAFTTDDISGTAAKATGNANGNEITDTVIKGLSISGKTITYTKIDGNTGTLTTQDTVYTHPTTSGNKHIPSGGSSGQFLGWDSDGTAKWVNNPNTNTDTLMTQNVSTTDSTYPILLCATANATSNQGAKTGIFGSGVKVNPKTSVVSAKGFSGVPTGTTYVSAVKDGGALVNSQTTSWGAIWRAPTKDYQVAGATWSSNNNNVYICYSVTNANAEAGTNTMAKSLIWAADTGTLTTTTFSGALSGNASSATQFSANTTVALTGDATGTSAGSKKGWSVPVTLANSGVTAGTYGPSADVTGNNNATISVPEITVDAKGRVTSVTNRTLTCKNNTYNVYNKTLTIQKNGTNVATFTSNSNTDVTANITVPTKVSELTNDSGYLTAHQSLSNYVTLNTAQEITNTKTFKDANTVVKRTDVEAGNTLPSADKLARNIFQDKNGKELGSIYYYKNTSGNTGLCLRAGDWFSESEGVYSLNASGTNRRAELVLYTNSSGDCCIQPNGLFSAHLKPLNSSICLAEYGKPFGVAYVNQVRFTNATLQVDVDIAATEEHSIGFFGKNNGPLSYITFQKRPSFKDRVAIRVQTSSSSYKSYDFDATCFYPESSNSVDIGSTTNIFKNIYCNNYYKGTTAFGDIVTHNASEFLTSHQSLSSCVKNVVTNSQTIKSTGITRGTAPSSAQTFGIGFSDNNNKYIGNIYGQYATDKSTYVGLYAYKGSTTSNGDNAYVRVGYDASGNVYTSAPTPATTDNSTQIATTAFVKAQGYLTSHQSLANYVTTNTDQSISGIKSHSKHISILGDYVGNESSTNGRSCLYLKANRDTDGKSGLYVTKFRQNVAQGSMGSGDVVFLSHDILENETRTNAGFVESYSNWEDDVPKGISVYSTIATRNLGTSAKPWTNAYAVNIYENGTALSSKYALNENFGKGTTTYLYIKSSDFPSGSGSAASIHYNDVVDGTKLYVWYSVCNSSSILDINPTAAQVTTGTGQVWRYLGPTVHASGLGHQGASPTGILGLFRRES